MRRVGLLALLVLVAAACGGDSRRGSAQQGGGSIGIDGGGIDGARHSSFDKQGDGVGSDGFIEGTGDSVSAQDVPAVPETSVGDDVAGADGSSEDQAGGDSASCAPACDGKICGDDGCGGVCGVCPESFPFCFEPMGVCSNCLPDCEGLVCGQDGCGGSCGGCEAGEVCEGGACVCSPDCPEEACGAPDGCGGVCPPCQGDDATDGGATDTAGDPQDTAAEDAGGPDPEDVVTDGASEDGGALTDVTEDGGTGADVSSDGTLEGDGSADDAGAGDGELSDGATQDVLEDSGDGPDAASDGVGDAAAQDSATEDSATEDSAGEDSGAEDSGGPEEDVAPPPPAPAVGELVITEIMREPLDGAATGRQWFEIVSVVDSERGLDGCSFTAAAGDAFVIPDGETIAANGRLVFAQPGDDADGPLKADFVYPLVANGGPDLSLPGVLEFSCATETIDAVDLTVVLGDVSFPEELGRALQLDMGTTNAAANDSPAAWCSSFKLYGAAGYGTPGVGNHPCDSEVDWCRIWTPGFKLAKVGELWEVTTHLNEDGLTNLTANGPDASPTLLAQVGFGFDGSLPAEVPELWTWFTATAVEDPPPAVPAQDDRYVGVVAMTNTGIYDVAGRFSLDDGISWTYCDLDGSANGYSATTAGHATVIP